MHEGIHAPGIANGHVITDIESAHLARNLRGELARIDLRNRTDTGTTLADVFPGCGYIVTDRRDDTHTGNDDATRTQRIDRLRLAGLPIDKVGCQARGSPAAPAGNQDSLWRALMKSIAC